jgi:ubiquinone biosynthesis accessory factor UbiK
VINPKFFDEFAAKMSELIAQSPLKDVEKNTRAMMQSAFAKMDLVTREEFDVQQQVLARTREKLEALEKKVAELEARAKA